MTTLTTMTGTVTDSTTMLRRNLKHQLRYPSVSVSTVVMPVMFLLLFVYVFGGTMGAGLATTGAGTSYVDFVVPGILVMTTAAAAVGTAISVSTDMTEGIVARFRTMALSRSAVINGHVAGSMIQTLLALALVLGVAVAVGFRASATAAQWAAAIGVMVLITFAITWLAVALGTVAKSVESASNLPMPLLILPFLGSGFVPTESMPTALQWFADYQPFTPWIDTVRGLLTGTPIGTSGVLALAWCAVITVGSYVWARSAYERRSVRSS